MTQNPELSVVGRIEAMPELPVVAWLHTMDNTEGLKGNKPEVWLTQDEENPFGIAGRDYSESFPVTSKPLCKVSDALTYASQTLASRDGEIARLREALQAMLKQFTKTPSTLADSRARGLAHAALAPQPIKEQ